MTDLFNTPLAIGDQVIYTTGAQSNTILEVGEIIDICVDEALIKTASGRKATNWRDKNELVNIAPIKQVNPEAFL